MVKCAVQQEPQTNRAASSGAEAFAACGQGIRVCMQQEWDDDDYASNGNVSGWHTAPAACPASFQPFLPDKVMAGAAEPRKPKAGPWKLPCRKAT